MTVDEFSQIFIKKDIDIVIKKYGKFRKNALLDSNMYLQLWSKLSAEANQNSFSEPWKRYVFEVLVKLKTICSNGGTSDNKEKRKQLNEGIILLLENAKEKIMGNEKFVSDSEIKYGILHLMLDVICAFSDEKHVIQLPAMIHDIVRRMNKEDSLLKEFYGEKAEIEIINYTNDIVQIIKKKRKEDISAEQWIKKVSEQQNKEFAKEFGKKMLDVLSEQRSNDAYKEKKKVLSVLCKTGIFMCVIALSFLCGQQNEKNSNQNSFEITELESEKELLNQHIQELEYTNKRVIKQNANLEERNKELEEELSFYKNRSMNENEEKQENNQLSGEGLMNHETTQEGLGTGINLNDNEYGTMKMPFERTVRVEGSKESERIGYVYKGDTVTCLSEENEIGWMKIQYESRGGNIIGYVYMRE